MENEFMNALKNSFQSESDFADLLSIQLQAMALVLEKTNPTLWAEYQITLCRLLKQRNFSIPNVPFPDDL